MHNVLKPRPIELTHVHVIITGDMDSSVYFEEDDQLVKTLKQFWETAYWMMQM